MDDGSWQHEATVSTNNSYWTENFTISGPGSGDIISLRANHSGDKAKINITSDEDGPNSFSLDSPDKNTDKEDPTVEVSVEDDYSGVKNISISANGEGSNECNSDTCSVNLENLDDGYYEIDITSYDNAGNTNSKTKTFTVDTSYDGDSEPDLDWSGMITDGILLMDDDETLTATFDGDDEEPADMACYDGYEDADNKGDEIDSDGSSEENDDNNYEFECDFDEDDYSGAEVDLTLRFCDAAGNCGTHSPEYNPVVFDATKPSVVKIGSPVGIVNKGFELDYTATDESGITEVEYFFDTDTNVGDGNVSEVDEQEGSIMVDVSSLESGENTVYVRAKDNAGRWSEMKSYQFEYWPDATPKVGLTAPGRMTVTAGQSKEFDVRIKNTGKLVVNDVTVTVSGKGVSGEKTIENLYPGESMNRTFSIKPKKKHIGAQTVTIETDTPSASNSFDVRIKANKDQRSSIKAKLSTYQQKLDDLKTKFNENKDSWGIDLKNRFRSNYSEFKSKVNDAETAVQKGRFYEAEDNLSNIDSSHSQAQNSYETVEEISKKRQRNQIIMFGVVGLLLIGGAGGGFLYFRSDQEFDFNFDKLLDSDIPINDLEGLKSRFNLAVGESEDEAEEFEWNGFK